MLQIYRDMSMMHIATYIFISLCLSYASANVSMQDCTVDPWPAKLKEVPHSVEAVASPPALADLQGIWYIFGTNGLAWAPSTRCGACLIYQKSGAFKMQCILQVIKLNYQLSKYEHYFKYLTGTLTKDGSAYKFSPAHGSQDAIFVVTTWTDKNSQMTVALCQFADFGFMKLHNKMVLELARKKPATLTTGYYEVDHKDTCLDVVFDKSKEDGQEQIPAPCEETKRPNSDIPAADGDCTAEGWKKKVSGPTTKDYKFMPLKKTFADAKTVCEDIGTKLAKVENQDFLDFLKSDILLDSNCQEAWIGLQHTAQDDPPTVVGAKGTYQWSSDDSTFQVTLADGNPVAPATFTKWCKAGNIADTDQWDKDEAKDDMSCFTLDKTRCSTTFGWKERTCTVELPFICQRTLCPDL